MESALLHAGGSGVHLQHCKHRHSKSLLSILPYILNLVKRKKENEGKEGNVRTPPGTDAVQRQPNPNNNLSTPDAPQPHQRESSTPRGPCSCSWKESTFSSDHFSAPFMHPHRGMLLKPLQASSLAFFFLYGQMFSPFSGETRMVLKVASCWLCRSREGIQCLPN